MSIPLKILIPQPVIGELVVKSIEQKKKERIDHFISFLFEQNKILDFPILDHEARYIASRLNNKRLSPNDLHIVSISIIYAKNHQNSTIIFFTTDKEILDQYTREEGKISKCIKEDEIKNFKISELR